MTVVLLFGAIAVVAAFVARATWRSGASDERHSVRDYQHTIETLRNVSTRTTEGRDATTQRRAGERPKSAIESSPTHHERSAVHRLATRELPISTGTPRTEAARGSGRAGAGAVQPPFPLGGHRPGREGHLGPRWLVRAGAAAFVVVALGAGLALTTSHSRNPVHKAGVAASATTSSGHRGTSGQGSKPPGSSAPRGRTLEPTASSAAQAAYAAPSSTYIVGLVATGPCWVLASDPATGKVLWTGTLQAGQDQQIPNSGSLLLRLGAAFDVNVTLNGEPVIFPAGHGSPFDVAFQAA
jgi:hypothetical protein